ncbi:MAG: T9SS type A sorting domain-containing protein [Planctomycetia bacterium]|nr:T9SS type A sorting domain-containing protein [Planctomycetia bacterium]
MKLIAQLVVFLTIACQLILAQEIDESQLKCSHAKTAKAMFTNYAAPSVTQADYDVTFYDIDLKIDPAPETISGSVGVQGISLVSSLSMVELDLYSGLSIESIKNEQGDILNYVHDSNLLSITLNNPVSNGNNFNIIIKYGGKPPVTGFGSFTFDQYNEEPMISSLSEPYGARDWWPCKDTPNDKADSVDISLEVPTGLIAASNGKLVNTEINGEWTTYHWQERYPIATYLVSVAIYPYTVFYDWYKYSPIDSMRLEYYVFPDNYDKVQNNYSLTKDMIGAMADRFGEYPFIKEKYGHAEFTWGGGMEHQTLTSLGGYSEGLIAHELGHQWWGDMATCASFQHIWLNEGFATYSEALWYEKRDNNVQSLHSRMNSNKYYGSGTIFVEDTSSVGSIFNGGLSYAKASWVLHMLRHIVGDSAFFAGLQEYGDRYRFKSVVTEQFRDVMEEISGMDLDSFFERWIYGEYYPIYNVTYNFSNNSLFVLVEQTQASEIFKMPIDIKATFTDESELIWIVENTIRKELFTLPVPEGKIIQKIEIDPDDWILKKVDSITIDEQIDTTSSTGIPTEFHLYPVYPNPFNAGVTIRFTIENEDDIQLNIFDIKGNSVWQQSAKYSAGNHFVKWDGRNLVGDKVPSGTYIVEVSNGTLVKTEKMLLLK